MPKEPTDPNWLEEIVDILKKAGLKSAEVDGNKFEFFPVDQEPSAKSEIQPESGTQPSPSGFSLKDLGIEGTIDRPIAADPYGPALWKNHKTPTFTVPKVDGTP